MKKIVAGGVACVAALALSLSALATGTVPAQSGEMILTGTVGAGAEQVISVTMPYEILFTVKTAEDGKVESVLSAQAPVVNSSNCAVKLTITAVKDPGDLLGKVKLALAEITSDDAALQSKWMTEGQNLSVDLLTLEKPTGATKPIESIKVFGAKTDADATIPTGSYTVTPTIKVEAVAAP